MALPRLSYLDPRPSAEALGRPIADAVNIPFEELAERLHELPPPGETVRIAASPQLARQTGEWLERGGRCWEAVVDFAFTQAQTPGRMWEPHPFVRRLVEDSPVGQAVDLGCGTGRDSIYLSSAGWRVTAVDHLADAIQRGSASADRLGVTGIDWVVANTETFLPPGEVDLILMIFFCDRHALMRHFEALRPGGSVLMEVYTPTHRLQTGKPRDSALVMDEAEARSLFAEFDLRECDEGDRRGRHTLRVWARKL